VERELYLATIQSSVADAFKHIRLAKQERPMLEMM
jgi:hypothetical protein